MLIRCLVAGGSWIALGKVLVAKGTSPVRGELELSAPSPNLWGGKRDQRLN